MSKLLEVLDELGALVSIEELIKSCENTMLDAQKAMKNDPESEQLKSIFNASKHDKEELLEPYYKKMVEKFEVLLSKVIADESFACEVESAKLEGEQKRLLEILKNKISSLQGKERPQE